ncbi:MAG TPA: PAS domain-containing protein, partial [Thermoanaerobaculia bacterium]
MTALLRIRSTSDRRSDAIVTNLRESGIDVRSEAPAAKPREPFDVVMIDPDVEAPLQVARQLRSNAPDAHIIFLTTPATDPALRRELLVGRIGTQWSIAPADRPDAAAEAVRNAIEGTERRRKLRTTLGRLNTTLTHSAAPPPRRAMISDHFLASVLDQLSDAIVVLDPSGGVLAYNGAAARAFGTIRRGAPFAETLPAAARQAIQSAAAGRNGQGESAFLTQDDGTEYGLRATSLRDAEGAPIGLALVARDITAARVAEKRRDMVANTVRVLATTLDVRQALQQLTDLLIVEFADVAAADIIEGEDVNRYAVSGRTPSQARLMESSLGSNLARNRSHPAIAAIAGGEAIVRNDLDEQAYPGLASHEGHHDALRELRPNAFIVAPLRSGDETVGALSVARCDGKPFRDADVQTMQEIAR